MWTSLAPLVLLATPAFGPVAECDPSPTVGWQNALYGDDADGLFRQEGFLSVSEWGDATPGDPTAGQLIADCFGEVAPHSGRVVLHALSPAPGAPERVRPVLLVPGAGDNAIRSYTFMALALRLAGFKVYAVTFAHRHGDNFLQAEQVANVLGLLAERHGTRVDVVAHSKGGMPVRIYASNAEGVDWSTVHPAYHARGTRYRGEIGRLFFFGAPLGGLDTSFRWPSANYFPVVATPLDSPVSWTDYYPGGNRFLGTDLRPFSLYGGPAGNFPGQAQMLTPWDEAYDLPGSNPLLGIYATLQQDWFTTYYGGFGFISDSDGIGAAMEEAGDTMAALGRTGVDPAIALYVVAGGNPILSSAGFGGVPFALWFDDGDAAALRLFWQDGVEAVLDLYFPWWPAFEDELPRLLAGTGFLGEISGPSDGVLFVDSALDDAALTSRGAEVIESRLFERLNHVELLAAGTLFADFHANPDNGFFDPDLAAKYRAPENQVIEWLVAALSGPVDEMPEPEPEPDPEPEPASDAGPEIDAGPDPDVGPVPDAGLVPDAGPGPEPEPEPEPEPAMDAGIDGGQSGGGAGAVTGCTAAPGAPFDGGWLAGLVLAVALTRRR